MLVLSEPTRGVDVGAKSEIYGSCRSAAEQGAAIVLISSELPELLGIADRVVVFYRGEIRAEFSRGGMREEATSRTSPSPGRPIVPDQTDQQGERA